MKRETVFRVENNPRNPSVAGRSYLARVQIMPKKQKKKTAMLMQSIIPKWMSSHGLMGTSVPKNRLFLSI
jgi:hypothetical protein